MGIYINPNTNGNPFKSAFMAGQVRSGNAIRVSPSDFVNHEPGSDGMYGIVMVDNGAFDALGVAFDSREAQAFVGDASDKRTKAYFLTSLDQITKWDHRAGTALKQMIATWA